MELQTGLKYDGLDGKHPMKDRWDLLPIDCVEEVVKILTFGSQKYGDNSWQRVENAPERYYAALMRHLSQSRQGQLIDEESGLSHLSHAMCNVVFLLWLEKHKISKDIDTFGHCANCGVEFHIHKEDGK